MRSAALLLLILAVACGGPQASDQSPPAGAGPDASTPGPRPADGGTPLPDAGTPPSADAGLPDAGARADAGDAGSPAPGDAGTLARGCGALGGGPTGGPGDLFNCGNPYYRDISALPPAAASPAIKSALSGAGGWGNSNLLSVTFDFALLHANAQTPRRSVVIAPKDSTDKSDYYPDDSDLLPNAGAAGWPMPTPVSGRLEDQTGYTCPTAAGQRTMDCHLTVVDDDRHLLFELYSATLDPASGKWFATQESVWNLAFDYGQNNRGFTCTGADASGLPVATGLIGVREMAAAVQSGGTLSHALRFILPGNRIRPAFIAPASHRQSVAYLAGGPAFGARFRLRADFDENRLPGAGARVLARTLKKYGMILIDSGEYALTAETDALTKQQDPALAWSNLLGAFDLGSLQVADFDVIDYREADVYAGPGSCSVDSTPLRGVPTLAPQKPQGRPRKRRDHDAPTPRPARHHR